MQPVSAATSESGITVTRRKPSRITASRVVITSLTAYSTGLISKSATRGSLSFVMKSSLILTFEKAEILLLKNPKGGAQNEFGQSRPL